VTALALDTLAAVRAAGGDVRVIGPERLKVIAPEPLPSALVEQLRAIKPELLRMLSHGSLTDVEEECAGVPRDWAEGLARLDPARLPADVSPHRWRQFIDDAGRFLDCGWAARAAALGWRALDIFGCDRERPFARLDRAGLIWLIYCGKLIAMTADTATIERPSGARQTYRRVSAEPSCIALAWELA
jgi:hypothetical protein